MKREKSFTIISVLLGISLVYNVCLIYCYHKIRWERQTLPSILKECIVKDYDISCLYELEGKGYDLAIPYALYLADVAEDSSACGDLYRLVRDFYELQLGMEMPKKSFERVYPYLKRSADANDIGGLSDMWTLHWKGKYVQRDSTLMEEYEYRLDKAIKKLGRLSPPQLPSMQ